MNHEDCCNTKSCDRRVRHCKPLGNTCGSMYSTECQLDSLYGTLTDFHALVF